MTHTGVAMASPTVPLHQEGTYRNRKIMRRGLPTIVNFQGFTVFVHMLYLLNKHEGKMKQH